MRSIESVAEDIATGTPVTVEEAAQHLRQIRHTCRGPLRDFPDRKAKDVFLDALRRLALPPLDARAPEAENLALRKQQEEAYPLRFLTETALLLATIDSLSGRILVTGLLRAGDEAGAKKVDMLLRVVCGYDLTLLWTQAPYDGREVSVTCPRCKNVSHGRTATIQVLESDV